MARKRESNIEIPRTGLYWLSRCNEVERIALPFQAVETVNVSHEELEGAVAYGTAKRGQVERVRVAGKTGTAQFCDDIAQQMGICGQGSTAAVPVAHEIPDWYFHKRSATGGP